MSNKIGAGLKRGFEMTRDQIQRLQRPQVPTQNFEGMTDRERALYESALQRIPSAPPEQISPQEQYLRNMSPEQDQALQMELDQAFQNAKPMDSDLEVKKAALRKLQGR